MLIAIFATGGGDPRKAGGQHGPEQAKDLYVVRRIIILKQIKMRQMAYELYSSK
jgi:hypothetical protein